ncbi:MAG: hypothetical protein VKK63_03600 [Synechococcus sp.]|nr:hypothetical protein [Synechococcus sp.]
MVHLDAVTLQGPGGAPLVQDLSLRIRAGQRWALFSDNRQAASAVLRCVAGLHRPQRGNLAIHGHVSWPFGQVAGMSMRLSPQENSMVLTGIYGQPAQRAQDLEQIRNLVGLEEKQWHQALKQLPAISKTKLHLALSLAFDFDVYVVNPAAIQPMVRAGEWSEAWQQLLLKRLESRALITLAGPRLQLDSHCRRGLVLQQGQVVARGPIAKCHAAADNPAISA